MHPKVMAQLALRIENMHCGACVRRVTQTLNALPDTHADSVQIGAASVTTQAAPDDVVGALSSAGYPARLTSPQP